MREVEKSELIELYSSKSKHSNYQVLPSCLLEVISDDELEVKSRAEWQRLNYILKNVAIQGKSVLDIGGNSGFFSFELVEHGAKYVCLYEGNKEHANFAKRSAEYLKIDCMDVVNEYFDFDNPNAEQYELCLLLNVLHHVGDDYGASTLNIDKAKKLIAEHICRMSSITKCMVFQIGFNWKGDSNLPLFEKGTKKELIRFVEEAVENSNWKIDRVAIYDRTSSAYEEPNKFNLGRFDDLGEFLNRPIFLLKSL